MNGVNRLNHRSLLQYACGLTTAVSRPTACAEQLSRPEIKAAGA